MPGTGVGVGRMQRIGLRLLEEFENNGRFEDHRLLAICVDDQQRHLAQRRNRLEPVRPVGEVDGDTLERYALLGQRDRRALHIGA
ncbi:hypothetical protein X760_06020 [Mesorhizobium sp. LSHC422A00]|nr:hypothetical protein X760_06020 [Mesorhizobium sp. LSHC422A00]ESZ43026.1 hypothetical protein X732_06815 [Mesorhizobium sp. L2C066B000]